MVVVEALERMMGCWAQPQKDLEPRPFRSGIDG